MHFIHLAMIFDPFHIVRFLYFREVIEEECFYQGNLTKIERKMAEKKGKLQNLKNSIFPYSKFGDTSMVFVQAICETEANQAFAHVILY